MRKIRSTPSKIWLSFLPLLICLIVALILLAIPRLNPIFRYQGRIDLSMLILLVGLSLSLILLIVWISKIRNDRNREQSLSKVKNEAAQSRRRFYARLGHELKNPLTALHAQLEYLSAEGDRQTNQHTLEDMSTQLERLKLLVNGLRQLADIEEKQIDLTTVDVEKLLYEVIEIAQTNPLYSDRQIKLTLLQTPWKFTSIQGDRPLLSLAVYNLLDNALKFTSPEDSVEIRAFEMNPWLIIEIADTGSGILDDDLPFIFDELYRGKNANGHAGSGLGLPLVKTIIEHHDGNVLVQSRHGQGTIFSIRLPLNLD
jgi:two-component system OmpR family sensor kinase